MLVLFVFLAALALAFGYAFIAYLDNCPIIDEDEQYAALMAVAQQAHAQVWDGETA